MSDVTLNPPRRRSCVSCGREDVWDGEWTIREVDGVRRVGSPFCLHEWDITGTHTPITG